MVLFSAHHMTIFVLTRMVFEITSNIFLEDIFKLDASAAGTEFCLEVEVEINIFIPHVTIKSSLIHLHGF